MTEPNLRRRTVLATAVSGFAATFAGCSAVLGDEEEEEESETPPDPEIVEVVADVGNFRQIDDYSTTYILIRNNGGLGELKLSIEAIGEHVPIEEDEQLFSLRAGQELQTRFELFTHEGAQELKIEIEPTAVPENRDEFVVNEEETPDRIDYTE